MAGGSETGASSCATFRTLVLNRRLGCLTSVGGGLGVWSATIAFAHAMVQLSWSRVLITPFLERRVVCFTFLVSSVLYFRIGFVRWLEVELAARALACFGRSYCSPKLCQQRVLAGQELQEGYILVAVLVG